MRLPDDGTLRDVMGRFPTGVAIVTALTNAGPVGMTVQSCCSLSLDPPLVLFCVASSSQSWSRIRNSQLLCVNFLSDDQEDLARQFARHSLNKYANVNWNPTHVTRSPALQSVVACLECRLEREYSGGDHVIVVCRVMGLYANPDSEPLIYYRGGFHGLRCPGGGECPGCAVEFTEAHRLQPNEAQS
jgi:flavin reductase (DIM6/NTAB) family NADH-FMN oxidoreductase RutF